MTSAGHSASTGLLSLSLSCISLSLSLSEKPSARMRVLSAVLLLLLCSLQLVYSGTSSTDNNSDCCIKLSMIKIPLRRIKSYWWTNSDCPKKAVVFQTVKAKFCVDPTASWVADHLKTLDKRQNSSTAAPN
ncbi:C-C motif chemokine 13-like [Colossoma macropomum]|uniref:C-C motif chemokine 13-like n=1 Tax=Colossoma macropomum TaxID=42526 RepID=UPI00186468C6|nr:C-C motif chemokine 13-like [Colossoma macropomum]